MYFASDRTVGVPFPATRRQTATALKRLHDRDNGNDNIWRVDLRPWLQRTGGVESCAS